MFCSLLFLRMFYQKMCSVRYCSYVCFIRRCILFVIVSTYVLSEDVFCSLLLLRMFYKKMCSSVCFIRRCVLFVIVLTYVLSEDVFCSLLFLRMFYQKMCSACYCSYVCFIRRIGFHYLTRWRTISCFLLSFISVFWSAV